MTVAAPRTLATGMEAVLAATSNAPVPKSSSSASASATQAALFPDLLGQMVDSEIEHQPSSLRGASPRSKTTATPVAGASRKPAGGKNRTASTATTSEPGQIPVAPDPAFARTQYLRPPQHGTLSLTPDSSSPIFENSDAGGGDAAGKTSATLVVADGETSSDRSHPSQPASVPGGAAMPGQTSETWGPAGGEQPSNPIMMPAIQPTAVALDTEWSATGAAQQVLEPPSPMAVAGAVRGATESASKWAAHREPPPAGSSGQAPASATTAVASQEEPISGAAWQPAEPTQDITAAQAAYAIATQGVDAATSPFARSVASSKGPTLDPDRTVSERSDATAAGGAGSTDGDSLAEAGTLAFQALLVAVPASDPARASQGSREAGDARRGQQPDRVAGGGLDGGRFSIRSTRDAEPGLADLPQPAGASQAEPAAQSLSMAAPVHSGAGYAAAPQRANPPQPASPVAANLSVWAAAGPAPKLAAGGAAREIQLELRDADARVNVRLVERGGSVQVDVRTPDSHLAGSLRDDLPALTARLEQTGLRAETWHDAPAATATRVKMADPAASAGFQSSQNQSRREGGGRDPRDGQPQQKRQNQNQPESKEFAWLYTSHP